jgi:hypothetical protein
MWPLVTATGTPILERAAVTDGGAWRDHSQTGWHDSRAGVSMLRAGDVDSAGAEAPAPLFEEAADSALALTGTVAQDLLVVVAASRGRFRPAVEVGQRLEADAIIGTVVGKGRTDEVRMPAGAVLHAFLAWDNELVKQGQGVAWGQRSD